MKVALKYDIYFLLSQGSLEIYELIPEKKRWTIKLSAGTRDDIDHLMCLLTEGIELDDLKDFLLSAHQVCTQVVQFCESKHLLSDLRSRDAWEGPFLRQVEVLDAWNRTELDPLSFQERLKRASVLVVGAGGMGSNLASLLTSTGVGHLCCVDDDRVEARNLARQSLYSWKDIGQYKVDALANALNTRQLNSVVPVVARLQSETAEQIIREHGPFDVATGLAFPSIEDRRDLVSKLFEMGVPFLCVGVHDVGPFLSDDSDVDFHTHWLEARFSLQGAWNRSRHLRQKLELHPSYAPELAIVAGIAADEIIRFLSGYAPPRTRHGVFALQPTTYEVGYVRVTREVSRG